MTARMPLRYFTEAAAELLSPVRTEEGDDRLVVGWVMLVHVGLLREAWRSTAPDR
jgi:hypothetical protein